MKIKELTARYGVGVGLLVILMVAGTLSRSFGPAVEISILVVGTVLGTGMLLLMVDQRQRKRREVMKREMEAELGRERRARRKALNEIDDLLQHNGMSYDNLKQRLARVESTLKELDAEFRPVEPHEPMFGFEPLPEKSPTDDA